MKIKQKTIIELSENEIETLKAASDLLWNMGTALRDSKIGLNDDDPSEGYYQDGLKDLSSKLDEIADLCEKK